MKHLKRLALLALGLLSLGGFFGAQHKAQVSVSGTFVAMPGGGDYDPEPEVDSVAPVDAVS